MLSITSLKNKLAEQFSDLDFQEGEDFLWNASTKTVTYATNPTDDPALLLHETAHALLNHRGYSRDIELIQIERQAWDYAKSELGPQFGVPISEELVEDSLDSYRTWLHKRSTCPSCGLNGIQESQKTYRCINCRSRWSVNEARTCQLNRTRI